MRIVHIIVSLNVGGAERALQRLLSVFPEKSDILVVSLTDLGKIGAEVRRSGFRVEAMGMDKVMSFPTGFVRLVLLLRNFRPDVVQTWMNHANLVGGMAAKIVRTHVVIWGIRSSVVPVRTWQQRLLTGLCSRLSHVLPQTTVYVSRASLAPYAAVGYSMRDVRVIHNGLPDSVFSVMRPAEPPVFGRPFRIGCVGRWHVDKGQDLFLEAAGLLVRQRDDLIFVLAGRECNADNRSLAGLLDRFGLWPKVELLDEREDVPMVLAGFDVFCMPSRTEGFPNGLAEAMAAGLPCVATDVGDARCVLGDTGRFVPPESPAALAEALSEVLDLPFERRLEMGLRARDRVKRKFSVQRMGAAFRSLYTELQR